MTPSDRKILTIGGGSLAALALGYWMFSSALGAYNTKQEAIDKKQRELADVKEELFMSEQKASALKRLAVRALPGDYNYAASRYRAWLRESLENGNILAKTTDASDTFVEKGAKYGKIKFDIQATARLDDLTDWLHDFYSIDCMHRITSLKISQLKGSPKLLNVAMSIETLSLMDSTKEISKWDSVRKDKTISEQAMLEQLAAEREVLFASIVGRNPFGPPNIEPKIAPIGVIAATTGKPAEVIVKATDKKDGTDENDDKAFLMYRVVDADMRGYSFDDVKGILKWTPKEKGEYKATVEVIDDGIPAKKTRQTFTIKVSDPPIVAAAPSRPVAPKPTFDVAKWAYVTAIVQEAGVGQVWIMERSSGSSTKLKLGDAVEFGSVEGKVSRIDASGVEVETNDTKFFAKVGQSLGAAASQVGGS